ncbi:MAG: hypothetical protein ABI840_08720 [bacterium]
MLNSTLLEILRTFDKEEYKRLEDLLKSPYYNKNSNVIKLHNVLKKYYPFFKNENLKREKVWSILFPEKRFNYGVMKNLIFELQKLAEKMLHLHIYDGNKLEQEVNLLQSYQGRNLHQLYEKNLRVLKSFIEKSPVDKNYFYYKYMSEARQQDYLYYRNKTKDENFCNAIPMNENLMSFFFVSFFNENYNAFHESKYYNKSYEVKTLQNVLEFFENNVIRDNPYVLMYYYALKTVIDINDEDSYLKLKDLLEKNVNQLSSEKKFNFSQALINFCSFKIMKGRSEYVNEQFGIYKMMVEKSFYNRGFDNYISPFMYANVVSMAGNLKKFDWAEKFIKDFKDKLDPAHREQYFALANVTFNLKRKNFDEALKHLSGFKSRNEVEKITIKRFQLMIYYESEFVEELYSLIDTSKHFIANDKKVSDSAKKIFSNFLNFVIKIAEVKSGLKYGKLKQKIVDELRNEIEQEDVTNKIWLLEKVDDLSGKQ